MLIFPNIKRFSALYGIDELNVHLRVSVYHSKISSRQGFVVLFYFNLQRLRSYGAITFTSSQRNYEFVSLIQRYGIADKSVRAY
jgi:hypothetical protein